MIKVLELFAGIGACSKALERLGIEHEIVDAVEIDKFAIKSFNAIHGTEFETQDITRWDKDIKVDLIMHGSPCQDFSVAGKQAGGDEGSGTRSSLMYETIRIVEKLKPKYVIWENVKNVISKKHKHNFDNYINRMNELGYTSYYQVLNAKDYGIPQNRERVYTVSIRKDIDKGNFKFPPKEELKLRLKDMLEEQVDEKYYLSKKMMDYMYGVNQKESKFPRRKRFEANINRKNQDVANSVTTNAGNRPTDNFIKVKNATKKGYLEATEGDSINLSYPESKTRRGRVGHGVAQTLQCNDSMGVVERQRKDIKEIEKYCEYCGKQLQRKRFNGRLEDFTVFSNRKYCNRECMKRAYLKIGEYSQNWSNAHTTARKINELILHKEVCELCGSDTNLDIHHIDGNWQNNNLNNLMCLCRSCHTKYEKNKNNADIGLCIRKLTPREVWRLMGFDDEDFEKAEKVNSNTQLYKQARKLNCGKCVRKNIRKLIKYGGVIWI